MLQRYLCLARVLRSNRACWRWTLKRDHSKRRCCHWQNKLLPWSITANSGRETPTALAAPNQINHVITDEGISEEDLRHLRKHANYPVTVVGETMTDTYRPGQALIPEKNYLIGFANLSERMIFAKQVRRSLEAAAERHGDIELLIRDNAR